jgi:ketosteroid isomerase-like protein
MSALETYLRHVRAAADGDATTLRELWVPDGVVEFPYAAHLGSPPRLDGIDEIVDYFTGLGLFGAFTIGDVEIWPTGPDAWVLEMHASSTVLATGAPYEQDYVARFALAPDGRLTWMREYWDPTRA